MAISKITYHEQKGRQQKKKGRKKGKKSSIGLKKWTQHLIASASRVKQEMISSFKVLTTWMLIGNLSRSY